MARPLPPLVPAGLGLLVGAAAWRGAPVGWLVAAHGVVAAVTWVVWRRATRAASPLIAARAAVLAASIPFVGALAAYLVHPRTGRRGDLADAYRAYIAYDQLDRARAGLLDKEEALRRELSVTPLIEVLRTGDLAAKQAAAATLIDTMGAAGVNVLREALTDPDDETRLFASLALVRAEEEQTAKLAAARHALAAHDPALLLDAAHAARRYAQSGLPTGSALDELWDEVITHATAVLADGAAGKGQRLDAWKQLAVAKKARGDAAGAMAATRQAMAVAPEDPETLATLAEMLFEARDLEALADLAPTLVAHLDPLDPLAQSALYWLADKPDKPEKAA